MKACNSVQSPSDDLTELNYFTYFYYFSITVQLTKGKMKACSCLVILIFTCCICKYASVDIKPELQKNILRFAYGINYKYDGMLAQSFDRFYVVTKFILPTIND